MEILFTWQALSVFGFTLIADVIWAFYIRRVNEGNAKAAGIYSSLLWVLAAVVIVQYVKNLWLIIPGALGAWLGTYFTVKWDHRKRQSK